MAGVKEEADEDNGMRRVPEMCLVVSSAVTGDFKDPRDQDPTPVQRQDQCRMEQPSTVEQPHSHHEAWLLGAVGKGGIQGQVFRGMQYGSGTLHPGSSLCRDYHSFLTTILFSFITSNWVCVTCWSLTWLQV